ncbi:MAG: hypothetical protein ACKOCX_06115 [Planctomycetota bacterium]
MLSTGLSNSRALGTDETRLCYGNNGTNQIIRAALDGTRKVELVMNGSQAMGLTAIPVPEPARWMTACVGLAGDGPALRRCRRA